MAMVDCLSINMLLCKVTHTPLINTVSRTNLNATHTTITLLQINPRIDGCARALNLMSQGHLGLTEVIKKTQIKRCLPSVGKGSYYPGTGVAKFHINYSKYFSAFCNTSLS